MRACTQTPNRLISEAGGIPVQRLADYGRDRAQLMFPEKPSHEIREQLKRSGCKRSITNAAWQRQLTDSALASGRSIISGDQPGRVLESTEKDYDVGR